MRPIPYVKATIEAHNWKPLTVVIGFYVYGQRLTPTAGYVGWTAPSYI